MYLRVSFLRNNPHSEIWSARPVEPSSGSSLVCRTLAAQHNEDLPIVKVFDPRVSAFPGFRVWLERRALVSQRLFHPALPRVWDILDFPDGACGVVMESHPGGALVSKLPGAVSPQSTLRYTEAFAARILEALMAWGAEGGGEHGKLHSWVLRGRSWSPEDPRVSLLGICSFTAFESAVPDVRRVGLFVLSCFVGGAVVDMHEDPLELLPRLPGSWHAWLRRSLGEGVLFASLTEAYLELPGVEKRRGWWDEGNFWGELRARVYDQDVRALAQLASRRADLAQDPEVWSYVDGLWSGMFLRWLRERRRWSMTSLLVLSRMVSLREEVEEAVLRSPGGDQDARGLLGAWLSLRLRA